MGSTERRPGSQGREEAWSASAGAAQGQGHGKRRAPRAARGSWGSRRRKKAQGSGSGNLRVTTWEGTRTRSPGRMKWLEAPRGSCSDSLSTSMASFKAQPGHLVTEMGGSEWRVRLFPYISALPPAPSAPAALDSGRLCFQSPLMGSRRSPAPSSRLTKAEGSLKKEMSVQYVGELNLN